MTLSAKGSSNSEVRLWGVQCSAGSEDSKKRWPGDPQERGRLVVALQKAITASFDEGDWKELGHETGTIDWITGHGRLLRRLSWGDSDYGGHVFDAIEMLRKSNESGLEVLLGKEKIRRCLLSDSPEVYSAYVDSDAPVPAFTPRALSPKEAESTQLYTDI